MATVRELYFIRETASGTFYASTSSRSMFADEILNAIHYDNCEDAERMARRLSEWPEFQKAGALEIVRFRITIEELQASVWPSPVSRISS